MNPEQLFTQTLGLTPPWIVDDIDFDPDAQRIDFRVPCHTKQLSCSVRGLEHLSIHDRKARTWRHMDFFSLPSTCLPRCRGFAVVAATKPLRLMCPGLAREAVSP